MCLCPFLQESLLEIDEEEDTTDFGQAFFASHQQQGEHQAPEPEEQNFPQQPQPPLAKITHSIPWWPSSLIPSRQSQHNKDIKLIGRDGGVQIGRCFISGWIHTQKKELKKFSCYLRRSSDSGLLPSTFHFFISESPP